MSDWHEIDLGGAVPNVRSVEDIRTSGAGWITEVELAWLCDEIERLTELRGYCETLIESNYGSQEHGAAIDAIGEWIENAREI